jgi:hypothetical protein
MLIVTGSIIPTKFVTAASEVHLVVNDLGEVSPHVLA